MLGNKTRKHRKELLLSTPNLNWIETKIQIQKHHGFKGASFNNAINQLIERDMEDTKVGEKILSDIYKLARRLQSPVLVQYVEMLAVKNGINIL